MVNDALLECERAHPRRFPRCRRRVRAINGESLLVGELGAVIHRVEIVLEGSRSLLLLGERNTPKS